MQRNFQSEPEPSSDDFEIIDMDIVNDTEFDIVHTPPPSPPPPPPSPPSQLLPPSSSASSEFEEKKNNREEGNYNEGEKEGNNNEGKKEDEEEDDDVDTTAAVAGINNSKKNRGIHVVLVMKNKVLKPTKIKHIDYGYKKANLKTPDDFHCQAEFEGNILAYGKIHGKPGMENKYKFPPPADHITFYGTVLLYHPDGLSLETWETHQSNLWKKHREDSAAAAATARANNSSSSSSSSALRTYRPPRNRSSRNPFIPKDVYDSLEKTQQGYAKDGFVQSDSEVLSLLSCSSSSSDEFSDSDIDILEDEQEAERELELELYDDPPTKKRRRLRRPPPPPPSSST